MYVNSHFVITTTFLIWLYIARNYAYYYVRNMFMVAMTLALAGYLVYPTAPPRFLPEWGFTDTVANFVGEGAENSANALYNPFAAVPSMHVAFALMIAVPGVFLVRNRVLKVVLGDLPGARDVRGDGDRQPLLDGRRARRARGGGVRVGRLVCLRPRPAGCLGLAHAPRSPRERRARAAHPPRARRPRGNGARPRPRDARRRAQPPDRVAAHPERDLADGLRAAT